MTWTAARGGEICGGCSLPFNPNEPMALLTAKQLKRCQHCAGAPVDAAAVDAVLAAREAEQRQQAVTETPLRDGAPVLEGFLPAAAAAGDGLNQLLKTQGVQGVRRSRAPEPPAPKPFHEVADDPTIARLCVEGNK